MASKQKTIFDELKDKICDKCDFLCHCGDIHKTNYCNIMKAIDETRKVFKVEIENNIQDFKEKKEISTEQSKIYFDGAIFACDEIME